MGTDIYLVWDAETKGQREKQHYEEFVPKGKVGYLRANVWSVNENYALSQIFPEKYWRGNHKTILEYDFISNMAANKKHLLDYLAGKIDFGKENDVLKTQALMVNDALNKLAAGGGRILSAGKSEEEIKFRTKWAKEVLDFLELGARLQSEGKHPRVDIDW